MSGTSFRNITLALLIIFSSLSSWSVLANALTPGTTNLNDNGIKNEAPKNNTPEAPALKVKKTIAAGPVNNGDGTFALTYVINLKNSGNVKLKRVTLTDDLDSVFGEGTYTVDAIRVTSDSNSLFADAGFTGAPPDVNLLIPASSTLPVGKEGSIEIDLTVTPGANLGPLTNTGNGSAASASSGSTTTDDGSVNVTFDEGAEIGLAKNVSVGPSSNGDGSHSFSYLFVLSNSGDVPLTGIQVTDLLDTTFAGVSFSVDSITSAVFDVDTNYDGFAGGTPTLLTGTDILNPGDSGTITVSVTATPGANLGPYYNTATAAGDPPSNNTVTDTSDNGVAPDGNGNGDPTDDSDPTPITFRETPQLGLAKALLGTPTSNPDGSFTIVYRFVIENSGNVPVNNIDIEEDLSATFAAASSFTVDAVASTDFTVNFPGFNGTSDTSLLGGTDALAVGQSGSVDLTVSVTPGANLGPYNNSANVNGVGDGGSPVSDTSNNGADPDGNGNGEPTDDSDPTPVTFVETPEIGLAKDIINGPINNLDGTYTLTYRLLIENSGDVPVNALQIEDDLSSVFAAATSFTVDDLTSTDVAVNFPGFNGSSDIELLAGTDTLATGATASVELTITVTPGVNLGPYDNTATLSAESASGTPISDLSTSGTNPDGNGNGDPADDSVPTSVTFSEGPDISVSKAVAAGPTNNADGTYTLTYRLTLTNSGDTPLSDIQVTDDLGSLFGTGTATAPTFSVDELSSSTLSVNFPGFDGTAAGDLNLLDGTDILAAGSPAAEIDLTLTVTPGADPGPYQNNADAAGTSPALAVVTDTGSAPVVTFDESPQLGIAKRIVGTPSNNGDGSYSLTYELLLENSGDVPLSNLQITEDLSATFALADSFSLAGAAASAGLSLNPGFDGTTTGDINLLDGTDTLAVGAVETITLNVVAVPGATLGSYNNSASGSAESPNGSPVTDVSTNGAVPDANGNGDPTDDNEPTALTFAEAPAIGITKQVAAGPVNNGDGTHTLTYAIGVENTGDVSLANVQIDEALATTFTGATGFTVDDLASDDFTVVTPYNGNTLLTGAESLAAGASGTVNLTVTVTSGGNPGPYNNSATARATSPAGAPVIDLSDDSTVVDENGNGDPTDDSDPTPVTFEENAVVGVSKALVDTPLNNGDGSYQVTFLLNLINSGDVDIENLNVSDDLATVFAGADDFSVVSVSSPTLTINPGFTGIAPDDNLLTGTDILNVGQSGTISLDISVTPGANLGPYSNVVIASGTTPAGAPVSDESTDGTEPDANGNGDPTDDSSTTPVSFSENALLGIAKSAEDSTANSDGTFTTTITLLIENVGDVVVNNIEVVDDIAARISPATVEAIANISISGNLTSLVSTFNGTSETRLTDGSESLAVGETATISFDLTFRPNDNSGPFLNIASVSGESPANPTPGTPNVTDDSTSGSETDPDGNGNPGDNSEATPIEFAGGITGTDGAVDITDESVPGETLSVTVTDIDENLNDTVAEQFDVVVVNDRTGETETITVLETGPDTGVFAAQIATVSGSTAGTDDDGALNTQLDDTVTAIYTDSLTASGSPQQRTDTGIVLGFAGIEGNAWLDENTNDSFDPSETPLDGWIVQVVEDGVIVAEVPVNPDGSYAVDGLLPGDDYDISLIHPESGVTFGTIDDLELLPGETAIEQDLAIDPSGVFYDSVSRNPLADVTATMVDASGSPLPAACLLAGQQDQVSADDGLYRFDVSPDADPACPSGATYTLVFNTPQGYNPGLSSSIPPESSALDTTGLPDPVRIGDSASAPSLTESTTYYVSFTVETGDPDFVHNHIPVDPFSEGGFSVRLTKEANQRTTSIGGLVSYTITMENLSPIRLPGMSVVDSLPPGFSYVAGSAQIDGDSNALTVTGTRPVTFAGINLDPGERRTLRYILRASVGLAHGEYVNSATPFVGPAQIGNTDTARIVVVADPDFEQTTVIGKVWHDRDGDGWQDPADATNVDVLVELQSPQAPTRTLLRHGDNPAQAVAGEAGAFAIDRVKGRYGLADLSGDNVVTLRSFYNRPVDLTRITVSSEEGSQITLTSGNRAKTSHHSEVAAGLNSQNLAVEASTFQTANGYELRITITNNGMAEPGLPGVRLATVEGLLIETDTFGRYHIAGVDGGFMERGRNYIVKVDPVTLPEKTIFTTENPRVKRLSQGLMNNFDFGVQLPEQTPQAAKVTIKLAEMFFEPGSAEVLPGYMDALNQLAERIDAGDFVSIKIQAYIDPTGDPSNVIALAQARAEALRAALCDMLGRDVNAQIETLIETSSRPEEVTSASKTLTSLLGSGLDLAIQWLIPTAQAECNNLNCLERATNGAFVVQDISPSVYADSQDLEDQGRVDLVGERIKRLKDGGVIWWTEDPATLTTALAVDAPSHVPVSDGLFTEDITFVVYSNYARFFDNIQIEVFHENDVDRRQPIRSFDIDTREAPQLFYRLTWPTQGEPVERGASLIYRATATNADGLTDHTSEMRIFTIDAELYEQQQSQTQSINDPGNTLQVLPVDDAVVVFVPGSGGDISFEFRPNFQELGIELSAEDKATLDQIIADFSASSDIVIDVVGHTSSEGIAPRSQHLFADNYALSNARAKVVADYLASRLNERVVRRSSRGVGPDQPIADNATEEGRSANRRAEVRMQADRETVAESVYLVDRASGAISSYHAQQVTSVPTAINAAEDKDATIGRLLKRNDLIEKRIPVYGSRIRINGSEIGEQYQVWLNGEQVPIDRNAKFAVEYLMPIGAHEIDLTVADNHAVEVQQPLPIDISGQYQFLVALADLTVSSQDVSGSVLPLSGDERYEEDILTEGRLAFYLKGKVQGKYLITAQMDTREEEIDDLFSNIHKKDADSLFRRLDPDRYYPVYGDDSTTIADVNTQGRMYVRLEWDRSEVTWGNFETGFTGNELGQYSRGLYGAQATYESLSATEFDDSKTRVSAFVSESQTALGHSEFLGTGGSLYYLRHRDILPGSDKLIIEVRDPRTNRVIETRPLMREIDYEIDEIQGRVILSKPLLQVSQQSAPSLIVDGPLDGNVTLLIADYEYLPDDFDTNNLVGGVRGKQWLGDHVGIGATYVEEGRDAEDYQLGGVDVTLKAAENTWMKLEWGSTEATQTERQFSVDGGLSFNNLSPSAADDRQGDAYNVDVHINAGDFGGSDRWVTNAWFKEVDDQYSVARRDDGNNVWEYGAETRMPLSEDWLVGARASYFEVDTQYDLTEISVQAQGALSERGTVSTELKSTQENRVGTGSADALLLGLQYEHKVTKRLDVYGSGQTTLSKDGNYQNNDQLAVGAKLAINQDTSGQVEVRDGHRGNGLLGGLEHRINSRHTIYGTATHSTDNTQDPFARSDNGASMLDNTGTNFAAGHRWALNDRTNLFSEMQFSRNDEFSGIGEVFGLDYAASSGWHLGMTLQDGKLTGQNGVIDRQAYSGSLGYQSQEIKFSTRLEYREDEGFEDVTQWLTTNRFDYRLSPSYRLAAKLNYSESDSNLARERDAKLIEGSLGLARRPVLDNRFNWLTKYTYLHDLQSFGQEDAETDQRSHILSWEGIYKLNQRWDLGSKLARRVGKIRLSRNQGPWFESTVNFASVRTRWHLVRKWDAMAEYRWLQQEEADNERGGMLFTINRHIANNFKIGVGYNFTDFSDDLTDLDYDHEGWFMNMVGKY